MRLAIAVGLISVGCGGGAGDDYAVVPGNGGPSGGSGMKPIDAALDSSGQQLSGTVCLRTDPRDPASCATTGAGDIMVKLGTATATTADTGAFTIDAPTGSSPVWTLTGTSIYPSIVPYSANYHVPAITVARYDQLRGDNGVVQIVDQTSVVFAQVVHGAVAEDQVTATVTPVPVTALYYDGTSATLWDQDMTDAHGMIWVPEVDLSTGATTASMTVTKAGTPTTFAGIPLVNQAITFVTIAI